MAREFRAAVRVRRMLFGLWLILTAPSPEPPSPYRDVNFSFIWLGQETHAGQVLEMAIAGQQLGAVGQSGRVNDRVRRRQLVLGAQFRRRQGALAVSRSATTQVSVKAITRSAWSSPTSRVSHFANSSCTIVGTSHCAGSGNSRPVQRRAREPVSHSIQTEVSTSRIRRGRPGRGSLPFLRRAPSRTGSSIFGTGTSNMPSPLGTKANT